MTHRLQTVQPATPVRNSVYLSVRKSPGGRSLCRIIAFEDSPDPALQDLYGDLGFEQVNTILLELGMSAMQAQGVLAAAVGSSQVQRFRLDLSNMQCAFLRKILGGPQFMIQPTS